MLSTPVLTFRTINPQSDASWVVAHRRAACIATYGDASRFEGAASYLHWLRGKIEEFPDGFVIAMLEGKPVGQMELEVPYGLSTGYINLFIVARRLRRQGIGRIMHQYAENYFRAWEATEAKLHVSPNNRAAIAFYQSLEYRFAGVDKPRSGLWCMSRDFT